MVAQPQTEQRPSWWASTKEQRDLFDEGVSIVRADLGSYEAISQALVQRTGQNCTAATVRRWLMYRTLDVQWASTIVDLCREANSGTEVMLEMFFPWLPQYFLLPAGGKKAGAAST